MLLNSFRGYKQFEIGGALRPFHIGINQARIFCELKAEKLRGRSRTPEEYEKYVDPLEPQDYAEIFLHGSNDPTRITKSFSGENWELLVYSCLKAGYELKQELLDFELVHVVAWLEAPEWNVDLATEFISFFYETHTERIREINRLMQAKGPKIASA